MNSPRAGFMNLIGGVRWIENIIKSKQREEEEREVVLRRIAMAERAEHGVVTRE